jgi:hypothetical protein
VRRAQPRLRRIPLLFWVGRLVEQFVFPRINTPLVHVPTVLFALGALLFAAPLLA